VDYTTYTGIRTAVQDELNRSDATDALVASFIRISEMRTYRSLRVPSMEKKQTLFVVSSEDSDAEGAAFFYVPNRWLETITLTNEDGSPIEYVSQQYFRGLTSAAGSSYTHFTREANKFLVWPEAEDNKVVMYYYERPLAGDAATNNAPAIYADVGEALFFGAVSEGWRYFREEEKHQYYRQLFAEVLEQLQEQHDQSDISGATLITKNPYL
jgi:hypothetical protein